MKILIATGPLYPSVGNNANLLLKIADVLSAEHEVCFCSLCYADNTGSLPDKIHGYHVFWANKYFNGYHRKISRTFARVFDRNGYSDLELALPMLYAMKKIRRDYQYDTVFTSVEPFYAADAASRISAKNKILYLMDPPDILTGMRGTYYRNKRIRRIINKMDLLVTTPFIMRAFSDRRYKLPKYEMTGFPLITETAECCNENIAGWPKDNDGRITLLFCGWLCSDIRSPAFFLHIVNRLDHRFRVVFMGKECELLFDKFHIDTEAEVLTFPNQPYIKARSALEKADILINIGNDIPVHVPSKILEYINTGKPIINFHKMPNCPSLYYTERYPLCLNIYEREANPDAILETVKRFCLENRGNRVNRELILREYDDCTSSYIANRIMEHIKEK